ncbi:MAG: FAD:protein FMN transferase [Oligoflexia bacterium]|nr:FAD:protein FMN transferase [Oligoflexia bacterium]
MFYARAAFHLLVSLLLVLPRDAGAEDPVLTRSAYAMGTRLELRASARESESALREIEKVEARLSTWSAHPGSELSRLNALEVGQGLRLSPETARDLRLASLCRERTHGAFEPGIGALLRAWGVREGFREPSAEERERALGTLAAPAFRFTALADGLVRADRVRAGGLLEEGGFAKGVALDRALARAGARAFLDLGGQLAWNGPEARELALAHPDRREEALLRLKAEGAGSLATSGTSERGRHLLDPRTGEPAPDFGSVAVLARGRDGAFWADCLSTALYVLGPERGLAWVRENPTIEGARIDAVFLERSPHGPRARASCGLRDKLFPGRDAISVRWDCET